MINALYMEIGDLLSCLYKFERAGKIPASWLPAPVAVEAIDLELLGETGPITKSTMGRHEVSTMGFLIARWAQKALPVPSPSWLPQLRDVHPTWDPEWNILPRLSEPETGQPYPALFSDVPFLDRDIGNMETVGVQRHGTVPLVSPAMPDVDPRGLDGHARPIHRIPFSSDPALLVFNESMRLDDPFTLPDHIVFVESTGFRNSALLMLDPMIIDAVLELGAFVRGLALCCAVLLVFLSGAVLGAAGYIAWTGPWPYNVTAALFICMLLGTAVHVYHSIPTCADYPFGANESQGLLSLVEAHAVMESDGHEPQGEPEQVDDWEKAGYRRGYGSVAQRQIRADEKV
ncbi:hypothetical protein EHS25_001409 [Saitozyma podzolica]|uniref:Uncharacterized protein n=1 Tax=Saitozyma podzolica TaxID=1890683 RepID=A0A427YG44_9TREE|nr:hypothetical protein EHS25_001409 [Saitozyma podzolica]